MEPERIHYSNGMAIYNKRIWEARLEYGHLLTLTRDGETLTFLSQDDEEDQDKECYKPGDCLSRYDLELVAKVVDDVEGLAAKVKEDLEDLAEGGHLKRVQILRDLLSMNPIGPCILHYPTRRAIWMGSGWNMLKCNIDDRCAEVSMFGTNPGEITTVSGDFAIPRLPPVNDFGFFRVMTYSVSIEHYM